VRQRFRDLLQIKNSFLIVLIIILALILTLSTLLTRLAIANIETNEAATRSDVTTFVTNTFTGATRQVQPAVQTLAADQTFVSLFAAGQRDALSSATAPLFAELNRTDGIKQMQFTGADFKVFLRDHNPAVFGDDVTASRPTLVECITQKHTVAGLEQGKSGYGFRAATPMTKNGALIGCVELGADLDARFLSVLNANYPGKWAIVNLQKSTSIGRDSAVLATLNEPYGSPIRSAIYSTPEPILAAVKNAKPYYEYIRASQEMALYIPIQNFKGDIALYVRYVSPTLYYQTIWRMVWNSVAISVFGLLLTGGAFWLLYRGIQKPVHQLVLETEKIKNFDLKDDVNIRVSLVELEKLVAAVSDMKIGLRSFQKYVPGNLVRQLIETQQEARIGGKLKELTVFFSDIANFTAITEDLAPNELTLQLSEYFNVMTKVIAAHMGTVDKYIGDAVMAFWGAPVDMSDHALQACRAAVACQREIDALSTAWRASGKYEFHTRIGLATGEVVVGNVGSDQRLNYSVIGDPVNLASRLEGLNKSYKTGVLISEDTYQACAEHIEARLIDFVVVKGKVEPVRIYELIGERGDISPRQKESIKLFSRAIAAYLARDFEDASNFLADLKTRDPSDAVIDLYIARCQAFKAEPPPADWKGFYTFTTK
jgi:class 3 adenylate cyclase